MFYRAGIWEERHTVTIQRRWNWYKELAYHWNNRPWWLNWEVMDTLEFSDTTRELNSQGAD